MSALSADMLISCEVDDGRVVLLGHAVHVVDVSVEGLVLLDGGELLGGPPAAQGEEGVASDQHQKPEDEDRLVSRLGRQDVSCESDYHEHESDERGYHRDEGLLHAP